MRTLADFRACDDGGTAIEYGFAALLIGVAVIASFERTGAAVGNAMLNVVPYL